MKILHIIPDLSYDRGGPARSLLGMTKAQAELGADVRIVTGSIDRGSNGPISNVKVEIGQDFKVKFGIPSLSTIRLINYRVSESDIVHLHSVWTGIISYAGWSCRQYKSKTILSSRGMLDQHNMENKKLLKRTWLKFIEGQNLAALNGFHFQDESERDGCAWLEVCKEKPYIVQPNGVHQNILERQLNQVKNSASFDQYFSSNDCVNIVYLGRLHKIKGLDLQINLLAGLRKSGVDAYLHLIGPDDGAFGEIESLAEKLNIKEYVNFVGPIYSDERLLWLRKADIVLLTSHYECNSNTATEAMSVGGIVVATDTCHMEKPNQFGAACVVPRTKIDLHEKIIEILNSNQKKEQLRKRAKDYAVQCLDWSGHAQKMLRFYDSILST